MDEESRNRETRRSKPLLVLRPEWGGVFAWTRNPDGTHDAVKAFCAETGASRKLARALRDWQAAFENCIEPEDSPLSANKSPRVRSVLGLLDARAFELAGRLKADVGDRFRVAVAPLRRKWRDIEV